MVIWGKWVSGEKQVLQVLSGRPVLAHPAPPRQAQHPLTPSAVPEARDSSHALTAVLSLALANQVFANWWIVRSSDEKCLVVDIEPMTNNQAVRTTTKHRSKQKPTSSCSAKDPRSNIVLRPSQETLSECLIPSIETK